MLQENLKGFYEEFQDEVKLFNGYILSAIDEIGFLPKFQGVIVKDGTELYNKYGCFLSQCLSHIQRYLKGIYDFISHNLKINQGIICIMWITTPNLTIY